jgi:epsin
MPYLPHRHPHFTLEPSPHFIHNVYFFRSHTVLLVTKLMWEAIETPRPSAWRVIFKGLTLLEHLLKNGSERCVDDARNHSHLLRNLDRFNYYEGTVDRGVGVREKSKQVVEILQDDERIREERQKARHLREKFSGRGSVAGGGGGGESGDGGGRVKYEGYGNSDAKWASSSNGAGGGYGDGGIGSGSGRGESNRGYAGRYGEGDTAPSPRTPSSPTAVKKLPKPSPSGGTKVKKSKKKERAIIEEGTAVAAAAPEVDLFSFDVPAGGAIAPPTNSFDAFQAAPIAAPPAANDNFGDFQQIAPASFSTQFDAFGASPAAMSQPAFDAFGPAQTTLTPPMTAMNNAFGSMSMSSRPIVANATNAPPAAAADNDDFGDFEDADPVAFKSAQKSSDPLSNLISLDGLSKNPKKEFKPDNSPLDFSKPLGSNGGAMMGGQQQVFEAPLVLGTGKKGMIATTHLQELFLRSAYFSFLVHAPAIIRGCWRSVRRTDGIYS